MDKNKRKHLLKAGWGVGLVEEFLGLSEQESDYIEIKLQLAGRLQRCRKAKKITQAELAQTIRSSQSRVAKMVSGDPTISIDLLVRALLAFGCFPRASQRSLRKQVRSNQPTLTKGRVTPPFRGRIRSI